MITEDFVSFEVAKLLKEKGFNEPTWTRYEDNDEVIFGDKYNWNNSPMEQISAPTHQMTMKWLREVHQLHIRIKPTWALGDMREPCRWEYSIISLSVATDYMYYVGENTYEEAVEAALKYALKNLI